MFDKLDDILIRYEQVMEELNDPSVVNDQARFRRLMKEQTDLSPIVENIPNIKRQSRASMTAWRCSRAKMMKRCASF